MRARRLCLFFLFHYRLATQTATLENLARSVVGTERADLARQAPSVRPQVVYCERHSSLQACHDALPAAGGIIMLPSDSVFWLTETLNITKNNVTLAGSGAGSSIIRRSPALLSGDLITAWGSGFRITELTLDGNGVHHYAEELELLGTAAVVDGIEVRNNAHIAIGVAASKVKITASSLVGLGSANAGFMGIWFDNSNVSDLIISDNIIKDQRLNGIFGSGRNVEVARNYLSGNHRQVFPTGGGQIAIKGAATNSEISIVGNIVELGGGPATSGLEIDGPGVSIVWNQIRGQGLAGIILQSGFGHQVVGNTVSNSGTRLLPEPGVYVGAGVCGFRILGNRVYDDQQSKTQSWGIKVEIGSSDDYTIAGNDLRGNINTPGIIDGSFGVNRQVYGNF
jgi:parallel beta helix pectate lyase-like protein